jgi:hypothetical protein
MPDNNRPLRVFLCHSSGDKPTVRELYRRLDSEGWIDPWLDEEKLYPGQDWNYEIELAVEAADVIIVCLTNNSVNKEGYIQRELRIVLDLADYKPEGTLFIIPVRLEEVEPPKRLKKWQYADYFPPSDRDRSYERLLVSLRKRANAVGVLGDEPESGPEQQGADIKHKSVMDALPRADRLAPIQIVMKLAPFSISPSVVKLDGREIPISSVTTGLIPKEVKVFGDSMKVGEHRIVISWGGPKPGQLSEIFYVVEKKITSVIIKNNFSVWKSEPHWEIIIDYDYYLII